MDTNVFIIICLTIHIIILFLVIQFTKYQNKKKRTYNDLLESPKNYKFNPNYLNTVTTYPLIDTINKFYQDNNVHDIIISLSGGVDSMVTLAILIHLRKVYNFNIYAATIDYGLREESNDESKFLMKYCDMMNVKLYVTYIKDISRKKDDSGSRSEFEEESRSMRFNTYKKIISENNLPSDTGVFVAHHMDDIVENIFTNSMRGANLMDLEVMKPTSNIHGVTLYRPLLIYKKDVIYDFAYMYGVPYFKDTTPTWSKRGKMRNEIFPLLDSVFGVAWRDNLKLLGTQSNDWSQYINIFVINPWFNEIKFGDNMISIPIKNQSKIIYSLIIMKALHYVGSNMIKRTSVEKIMGLIQTNKKGLITLDGERLATLNNNNVDIILRRIVKV